MRLYGCWGNLARSAAVVAFLFGANAGATAQTVLIDFGSANSFRGVDVPAPDVNGNFWNSLTPGPFYANLIDASGAATTIDLGYDTPVGTDSFNGPAGVTSFPNPTAAEIAATDIDAAALGILGVKEAAIDFAASPGGADNRTRFQIQELDPAKIYDVVLFGSHKFSDADTTVYTIYSDNTYSTAVATASLNVQTPGSPNLHNRDTVATLSGVAPQASNILYVEFVGAGNALGYLNAMSLTARNVPEPASATLAAAAGLLLVRRRR